MIQCEGCYYQDKKENVCCHENPFFDIDDNCTDYVENEFVKKIRADAIDEFESLLYQFGRYESFSMKFEIYHDDLKRLIVQLKEQNNE